MTSRLLVTGATGFVGSYVVNLLASGVHDRFSTVIWDRASMGDLTHGATRRRVLGEVRPDVVLHLAWCSTAGDDYVSDPRNRTWGEASEAFMHECVERGSWFLTAGSAVDVMDPGEGSSEYAHAKQRLRAAAERVWSTGGVTWLRPGYIVSIEDERPRLVRALQRAQAGEGSGIRNPNAQHDFIHVRDVAAGVVCALERELHGCIEVCSGSLHSVEELANAVLRSNGNGPTQVDSAVPVRAPVQPDALLGCGWAPVCTRALFGDPIT